MGHVQSEAWDEGTAAQQVLNKTTEVTRRSVSSRNPHPGASPRGGNCCWKKTAGGVLLQLYSCQVWIGRPADTSLSQAKETVGSKHALNPQN
eukprot:1259259-Amphidinium_carterae.1